jgi:hypothetical protein
LVKFPVSFSTVGNPKDKHISYACRGSEYHSLSVVAEWSFGAYEVIEISETWNIGYVSVVVDNLGG